MDKKENKSKKVKERKLDIKKRVKEQRTKRNEDRYEKRIE
jgi:hypothetical protein